MTPDLVHGLEPSDVEALVHEVQGRGLGEGALGGIFILEFHISKF